VNRDVAVAVLYLLTGAALAALATWPQWALVVVLRGVLVVGGTLLICDALGVLVAKAMRAYDE
jgi:hypothetical protein